MHRKPIFTQQIRPVSLLFGRELCLVSGQWCNQFRQYYKCLLAQICIFHERCSSCWRRPKCFLRWNWMRDWETLPPGYGLWCHHVYLEIRAANLFQPSNVSASSMAWRDCSCRPTRRPTFSPHLETGRSTCEQTAWDTHINWVQFLRQIPSCSQSIQQFLQVHCRALF